jgi:hypothetical protein
MTLPRRAMIREEHAKMMMMTRTTRTRMMRRT